MADYAWMRIYAEYLQQLVLPATDSPGLGQTLLVEPYVGPVKIGCSGGSGRGLFLTKSVRAGELLLCTEAVVIGPNDQLLTALRERMEQSSELQDAVLALVSDPSAPKSSVPVQSLNKLAKPSRMLKDPKLVSASKQELINILRLNKYALTRVNAKAVPPEITQHPDCSGLWLIEAFINSSCCPNVQRINVRDHMFLRASRDLEEGAELFTCYARPLRPYDQRHTSLETYGFHCECERCQLEDEILDLDDVDELLLLAAKVTLADPTSEEPVTKAEELIAAALEQNLPPARSRLNLPSLPLPKFLVTASRFAMLRSGSLKPANASEQESLRCHQHLHSTLLASFGHFLQARAAMLIKHGEHLLASLALAKLADVQRIVLGCSEAIAATNRDMFHQKLLAVDLDWRKATKELSCSLISCHEAYGGGASIWRLFNSSVFSDEVLEAAGEI